MGPLAVSQDGHKYLLTVIDVYSGLLHCQPLKTITANTIALNLINIFCIYGFPKITYQDNFSSLISKSYKAVNEILGVNCKYTLPYCPQMIGLCERTHGPITDRLKRMCDSKSEEWINHVATTQMAHNIKPSARNGISPYEIAFGRTMSLPIESIIKIDKKLELSITEELSDKLQSLRFALLDSKLIPNNT